MLKGLRTIVYHAPDLSRAKEFYATIFGLLPYFDEPFYVGYNIGGYELGLDPDPANFTGGHGSVTYWSVDDIEVCFAKMAKLGVQTHEAPKNVGGAIWLGSVYDPFGNVIGLIENPEELG